MSGPSLFGTPRRWRRGATLTLVFSACWPPARRWAAWPTGAHSKRSPGPVSPRRRSGTGASGARATRRRGRDARGRRQGRWARRRRPAPRGAAGHRPHRAEIDRQGRRADREKLVSRSGDRWSSFYTAQEYAGFQQALDGRYIGVGLSVRRIDGGRIQVAGVQAGSPAAGAGPARRRHPGRRSTAPGARAWRSPRSSPTCAGTTCRAARSPLGVQRGARDWRVAVHRARLPTDAVTVDPAPERSDVVTKVDAFTRGVGRAGRRTR